MKKCDRLVRDNVAKQLSEKYLLDGEKLNGKKHDIKLCSLFLAEYKETLKTNKTQKLTVHYAEMLEIIRTLMVRTKTNIKDTSVAKNQPIEWYQENSPSKQKLEIARINLLQRFGEFLTLKTEAAKDQLLEIFKEFKNLVEKHNISFVNIEQTRREMYKRLGGYSKGLYLVSVSEIQTQTL